MKLIAQHLFNSLKSGSLSAVIWSLFLSTVLWFFSKPNLNFFTILIKLMPYALGFFLIAALAFEVLVASLAEEEPEVESQS